MKMKCDCCGCMVDEKETNCPNCKAVLKGENRFSPKQPQTMLQLRKWYEVHNLPPEEVTRFFIGRDIKEPRAFGIYQDSNGEYVVYKNKNGGERVVRYRGTDEAYAVNELYQRLKIEIANQKSRNALIRSSNTKSKHRGRSSSANLKLLLVIVGVYGVVAVLCILLIMFNHSMPDGHYRYGENDYYLQSNSWYYYDDMADAWNPIEESCVPEELLADNYKDYSADSYTGARFEDSNWYVEESYSNYEGDYGSNWEDDSYWDSGDSWDSGYTDWDSDW